MGSVVIVTTQCPLVAKVFIKDLKTTWWLMEGVGKIPRILALFDRYTHVQITQSI